ncbi:hypothetical protein MPTK1_1g21260 [Marchantia polymorpha subsp. ruderalis]|uniref:Uncharacterized protein n=2 Tax=Marchantia polymorpha TaxID=3197 RepID=A0AAF6ASL0_MARPO|nr:hypothetical protein MARPO_0001s0460 [Marchantia polymorpha]BBM99430.1 hypothetical protein Mp_1g21260 [Marchantia polymorpha subsp. ruderalis]|eukprot:PTQ50511.1 hypothetical protein MARPO_0001s0460 [Marchantia polymorpha]
MVMAQEHVAFSAPLIAKLEAWGYGDKSPAPLAHIISALDSQPLALVERLSNDLTHVNEISHDLRVKVAALTDSLKQERLRVEQLVCENQKLVKDKAELEKNAQEFRDLISELKKHENEEEQVQQWRAQSMHQLQELESMNQALRSTLNLQSCCLAPESKDVGANQPIEAAPKITLTKVLAARGNIPGPLKTKVKSSNPKLLHLVNVADMKCKLLEEELHVWKEKHTILEDKLQSTERELTSLSRNTGTGLCSLSTKNETEKNEIARLSSKDVGVCTESQPQKHEDVECGASTILPSSKLEDCRLMNDLLSLFQDYEKGLKRLTESHFFDLESLTRLGTLNKHPHEDFPGDENSLEKVMQEFSGQLQFKSKQQGLAALCTEGTNYQILPRPLKMNGANEELDQKLFQFGQKIIHMIKSIISFKDQIAIKLEDGKAKVEELRSVFESQRFQVASLRSQLIKKTDEINFIMDEKVVGEEALQASQLECNELSSLIKEIDGSMVQLTTALASRTWERDQDSESRKSTEQELRKRYSNLLSQLDDARNQVIKLKLELEQRRTQQEKDKKQAEGLISELQICTKRMESAEQDVEQLKTLIIQLDAAREDLVDKLESTMSKEQQAEKHIAALEGEVVQLTDLVQNRTAEVSNTCGLLEVLSNERDHLQSELNNLRENLSLEEATRNRLEELWNSKSSEHRAAAEELAALKCDYQLLKTDLVQLNEGSALLMEDLRIMTDKANQFHQALIVREREQENIFRLYESVCEENHHLKLAVYEIENQIQQQMFHHENMEGMLRKADEQVKALVEENERVVSELKGLERQADLMTRSLNQQSVLLDDHAKEKSVFISQLAAAKVAISDLETKLSKSLMEMATLEEKNRKLSEMLQNSIQEVEKLSATSSIDQERVKNLEHLLACVREEEQKLEMASKDTVSENLLLRERVSVLQEQVNHLQVTRSAQNQDIMRLQMSKNRIEVEESRRLWSTASFPAYSTQSLDSQPYQPAKDLAASKIQDLEKKIASVTTDLSKTTALYKDCLSKLQRAESSFSELRTEFDHVLGLLTKVDEERIQLREKCAELEGTALKHPCSGHNSPVKHSHPEIVWMQKECHRLKKESALLEPSSETATTLS